MAFFILSYSAGAVECASDATFNTGVEFEEPGFDYAFCTHTPDSLMIGLFELGICTSNPTPEDISTCVMLFSDSTGTSFDLAAGRSIPLISTISIPEGVYTHAYVLMSTSFSLKGAFEFDTPRVASDGTSGPICFTNGPLDEINQIFENISCGDSSAAVYSDETLKVFTGSLGAANTFNSLLSYSFPGIDGGSSNDLYQLNSDRELSLEVVYDGLDFVPMSGVDRPYIMISQRFPTSTTINADTQSIDLGVSVTNSMQIGFTSDSGEPADGYNCSNLNGDGCVADAAFGGLAVRVTVTP